MENKFAEVPDALWSQVEALLPSLRRMTAAPKWRSRVAMFSPFMRGTVRAAPDRIVNKEPGTEN